MEEDTLAMKKLSTLFCAGFVACTMASCRETPEARRATQDLCRSVAVARANSEADRLCFASEWADCEFAAKIEAQLMEDLEKCDG